MKADRTALADSAPLVLIVEDDEHAARVASDMMRLLGYRSRIAGDGHQALYALAEGPPDLLLLDIHLPEMDGVSLMRVMRRVKGMAAVPVVAASAIYPSEGPVARVLAEQGVTTYLTKPFMMAELRRAVDEARSAAMKFGPPPTATMTDGQVRAVTEEEVIRKRQAAAEAKAKAKAAASTAPAPPARTEASPTVAPPSAPAARAPAPPTPPRLTTAPAPLAPPPVPLEGRLTDSAEHLRPSPWGSPPTSRTATRRPSDTASLGLEVSGQGMTREGAVDLVFLGLAPGLARVRSVDRRLRVGQSVRVEMGHRIPVHDAMTDVRVRMILRVDECEDFGRGSAAVCTPSGAQPQVHFDALVLWFASR